MAATPDERRALMEHIEGSDLGQLIGWGMDRYERAFTTLAEERSSLEDAHRRVHQDGTVEDPDPHALSRALEQVEAAEAKIVAAITRGSLEA